MYLILVDEIHMTDFSFFKLCEKNLELIEGYITPLTQCFTRKG